MNTFFAIFPLLSNSPGLSGLLKDVFVEEISFDKEQNRLSVTLLFQDFIPYENLAEIEAALETQYQMKQAFVSARCAFSPLYIEHFQSFLSRSFPSAAGFLSGARWTVDGERVQILLTNGIRELADSLQQKIIRRIYDETGQSVSLSVSHTVGGAGQSSDADHRKFRESELEKLAQAFPPCVPEAQKKNTTPKNADPTRTPRKTSAAFPESDHIFGKPRKEPAIKISDLSMESGRVAISGDVFFVETRDLPDRGLTIFSFDMTDGSGSVRVTKVLDSGKAAPLTDAISPGVALFVQGAAGYSKFEKDTIINPTAIARIQKSKKTDDSPEKRVELHLHTNLSAMDAAGSAAAYIERAAAWGHEAIAITDHGVVQAFPEAMKAAKKYGVKVIYGVEGYFVNDLGGSTAVSGDADTLLDGEIVAFDLETTGLRADNDAIIEIAAVIVRNGEPCETYHTYINPNRPIPEEITKLTGITEEMVRDAPAIADALSAFLAFIGDRPLAAHNASFDMGFLWQALKRHGIEKTFTSIDTLDMARALLPGLKRHRLNHVAEAVGAGSFAHHRADEDTMVLARILIAFFNRLKTEAEITRVSEINGALSALRSGTTGLKSHHIILLAQNKVGLFNLYKLVSDAHLKYFNKRPLIPASLLSRNREGLLVGAACESGELFSRLVAGTPMPQLLKIASFYDFLEIQPVGNNAFLIRNGTVPNEDGLRALNRQIVEIADKLKKPVVATGDVHFLNPEDEIFRRILMAGQGFADADCQPPLYFRTTEEMLREFSYLGDRAYEVVIRAPRAIAAQCETITPIPISENPFPPELPGSKEDLTRLTYEKARRLYGDPLPEPVDARIKNELHPITSYGFDVMYMIAQKLVAKSLESGYLVGSRGSVGSSIVAYMAGITEVNALPPHYRCPQCKMSEFFSGAGYGCGADMPDKTCPNCGTPYEKDGFDIPFATFLGFDADKAPDIDLNFSGEYQAVAHRHTMELFGEDHVFRAGTIGTVAERTAYGFVKKYLEERGLSAGKAEINRLVVGCTGIKRTTGQHPGGLIVVPKDRSILEFTPVQHPADDPNSDIITTHFDYHSIDSLLLKLDLLAHDNPTSIRMLEDLTGVDATAIALDDPDTMRIFTSTETLGFLGDPVLGNIGAAGIPEFGTRFVREMLSDTRPTTFEELTRISGLSHGTNVWIGNAQDLVRNRTATLKEIICTRDDIMLYLIQMGVEPKMAFFIMENVRKGKGLKPEWEKSMRESKVPEWYIESCNKISYMFPKAHAVAYVMMAFRIAWFKVHRPLAFYCTWFTSRIASFDARTATRGIDFVREEMQRLSEKADATTAEKESLITLEVVYEFYVRGFSFSALDLYRSHPCKFLIDGNLLIPPLSSLPGIGEAAAFSIAAEREKEPFLSVEEIILRCPKVSKAVCETLKQHGALGSLPDSDQISLFG